MLKTPLNENQIKNEDFDFELTFLDSFVKSEINEGKKVYDSRKKKGNEHLAIDIIPQSDLNFGHYPAPQRGFNKNAIENEQNNPLFFKP